MVNFNVRGSQVLGINNISNANSISVYPNPANSEITINTGGLKLDEATIYDMNGQRVIDTRQNQINVSSLAEGIYFIEVKTNDISTRVKFVRIK